MTTDSIRAIPRRADVAREQLRAVGLALRPAALLITGFIALLTVLFLWGWFEAARDGETPPISMSPQLGFPGVLLGLVVPFVVWKNEDPAHRSYLWSLPVERGWHQQVKCGSGWIWFMGAMAAYLLWAIVLTLLSGNDPWVSRTVVHLPDGVGRLAQDEWEAREMSTPAWQWAVPFVAGTFTYLVGTVAALRSQYPWRWIAGGIPAFILIGLVLNAFELRLAQDLWESILKGPYGLETLVSGQIDRVVEIGQAGRPSWTWRTHEPALREWLTSVAIWLSAATVGAVVAVRRHQEP